MMMAPLSKSQMMAIACLAAWQLASWWLDVLWFRLQDLTRKLLNNMVLGVGKNYLKWVQASIAAGLLVDDQAVDCWLLDTTS